jgi:hypothetical protein
VWQYVNPLNTELNSIFHLLALLRARLIFHVSRIRVNPVLPVCVSCTVQSKTEFHCLYLKERSLNDTC